MGRETFCANQPFWLQLGLVRKLNSVRKNRERDFPEADQARPKWQAVALGSKIKVAEFQKRATAVAALIR